MNIPMAIIGPILELVALIKNLIDAGEDDSKQLKSLMDAADKLADEIERRKFK